MKLGKHIGTSHKGYFCLTVVIYVSYNVFLKTMTKVLISAW